MLIYSTMTVSGLKQKYLFIPSQIRDPYLYHLLLNPPSEIDVALRAQPKPKEKPQKKKHHKHSHKRQRSESPEDTSPLIPSTIIFTQRCATAHLLHLLLNSLEIESVPLHSHLTQPQRLLSLARFRNKEVPVLVTTDVGSRGLDIPEVAMVINWDCPRRSDDYIHRVGRTARAGRGGVAVTIVTERDVDLVQVIEKDIGVELVEMELPEETVLEKMNAVSLARRMATMVCPSFLLSYLLLGCLLIHRKCTIQDSESDRLQIKPKPSRGPRGMLPNRRSVGSSTHAILCARYDPNDQPNSND
jgi:ATP-dependent RNA helicase DDX49/DBP8